MLYKMSHISNFVFLTNSHLRLFLGKLECRWLGQFTISKVFLYSAIKVTYPVNGTFKVNGHRLKPYFGENIGNLQVVL